MEWVAGENPKELLSLTKGVSEKVTEASEKQNLEAKSRLLDLVFTNKFNKLLSTNIWNFKLFYGERLLYVTS